MPAVTCHHCQAVFEKVSSQILRSNHHYCSRSCAAQVNNRLTPKRQVTNHCRVCGALISQRQTYCPICRVLPLTHRRSAEKFCGRCGQIKPMSEFYVKSETSGLRQAFCKVCFNAFCVRRWQERKLRAVGYLGGRCQDCQGVFHPNVYDFHHLRDKDFSWNQLRLRTWDRVKAELDKCALLCANCHRLRHTEDAEEEDNGTPHP